MSQIHFYRKNPQVDLKLKYSKTLEKAFVASVLILIFVFYSFRNYKVQSKIINEPLSLITEVVDIPKTFQRKRPPKPTLPSFPIGVDDPEMADAVTISYGSVNIEDLLKVSPPPADDTLEYKFYAVEQQPKLIKKVEPYYPEIAQKAGIEGDVVVKVLVGKKGDVEKVELIKSAPLFDKAAIKAAGECKFRPGKQRDKFVRVWFSIPFKFKLR